MIHRTLTRMLLPVFAGLLVACPGRQPEPRHGDSILMLEVRSPQSIDAESLSVHFVYTYSRAATALGRCGKKAAAILNERVCDVALYGADNRLKFIVFEPQGSAVATLVDARRIETRATRQWSDWQWADYQLGGSEPSRFLFQATDQDLEMMELASSGLRIRFRRRGP